jgi:homopolymeric O-antigen transport system ATP-binding protein
MKPIITVQNLSKKFRIDPSSAPLVQYNTLRESLAEALRRPLRRFGPNGKQSDDIVWALKDVSFEVNPGEVMGIIGPNGAGKSTLLKILSRIIDPTSGRVELYGRVGSLLEVGTGFHPDLTGRENIYLNGAVLGMKRVEINARFDEIVAFAEVEKFIDTAVKRYSSGMYVRLGFAVAAHLNPDILIVDEVLSVGDASFQRKCLGKMDDVVHSGRTVLFVTHNLSMITQLCEHAILLKGGVIDKTGPAGEVVRHYERAVAEADARRKAKVDVTPSL